MRAKVYITTKQGVLDPQGRAIERSLHSLGFTEAGEVRLGKFIELELNGLRSDEANDRVTEMCKKLLANEVIEDFRFELEE